MTAWWIDAILALFGSWLGFGFFFAARTRTQRRQARGGRDVVGLLVMWLGLLLALSALFVLWTSLAISFVLHQ
ncbi:MAG TPA: hypothetical protein PKE31_11650 [Pseudomonadota bacterium]|jgi:hypothetical protein|nr:hypothetical protein [Pseudomonadota bacterium]